MAPWPSLCLMPELSAPHSRSVLSTSSAALSTSAGSTVIFVGEATSSSLALASFLRLDELCDDMFPSDGSNSCTSHSVDRSLRIEPRKPVSTAVHGSGDSDARGRVGIARRCAFEKVFSWLGDPQWGVSGTPLLSAQRFVDGLHERDAGHHEQEWLSCAVHRAGGWPPGS